MADINTTAAPPVPLEAPLLTAGSMDDIPPGQDRGFLTDSWVGFFRAVWAFLKVTYANGAVIVGAGGAGAGAFQQTLPTLQGQFLISNGVGAVPTFQPMQQSETVCDTTLTVPQAAYGDVLATGGPGGVCGVTLGLVGHYAVIVDYDVFLVTDSNGMSIQLVNAGGIQNKKITLTISAMPNGEAIEFSGSYLWVVNNLVAGNICNIQAKKTLNAGATTVLAGNTSIQAIFLG